MRVTVHLFSQVEVQRIEGIQGKEYRALIVSTVRTCSTAQDGNAENEDGFLNNIKVTEIIEGL